MSKTYRRERDYQAPDEPYPTTIEEDEDTDPRSYNVIQRFSQERDSRRMETGLSAEG